MLDAYGTPAYGTPSSDAIVPSSRQSPVKAGANVFVVPSKTTLDIVEGSRKGRKAKKLTAAAASNEFIKRNFLLAGGGRAIDRAYEDHAIKLNKAAMKDLRNANVALATELARAQDYAGQEVKETKMECDRLEILARSEKEKHAETKAKLESELSAREEFASEFQHRVKDLQKRLRDEHKLRAAAESEVRTLRDDLAAAETKADSLAVAKQTEAKRLNSLLEKQRESAATLEEMLAAERKLLREVTERSGDLADRLEATKEKALKERERAAHEKKESAVKFAQEKEESALRFAQEKGDAALRFAQEKEEMALRFSQDREAAARKADEERQSAALKFEAEIETAALRAAQEKAALEEELRAEQKRAAVAAATTADQIEKLEARARSQAAMVVSLEEKNNMLSDELSSLQSTEMEAQIQVKRQESKINSLEAELATQKKGLNDANEEIGRLHSCLREQETVVAYNADKASVAEKKLEDTEAELAALMRSLEMRVEENAELGASMEAVQRRWQQLKQDLASREQELESAKEEIDNVNRTLTAEMKSKVSLLTAELDAKEEALRDATTNLKITTHASMTHEGSAKKAAEELHHLRQETVADRAASEEKVALLTKSRDALAVQLECLERTAKEKDAMFASLKRSTTEDMQALQAETATLSREAARWREHHAHVKQQLDKKERQLELMEESSSATAADAESRTKQLSELSSQLQQRLSTIQGELAAEQQRSEETKRDYDSKLSQAMMQVSSLRETVKSLEDSSSHFKMEATRAEQELSLLRDSKAHDQDEAERLRAANASSSERVKALRQELVAANSAHMREMEEKSRVVNDVLAAMSAEEKAKNAAIEEARQSRYRLSELESQLEMVKGNLHNSIDSKRRTEDAFSAAQSALQSMKQKAGAYRKENKMLLSNYDTWLKTLVETRTPSPPKQRMSSSPGVNQFSSPARSFAGSQDTAYRGGYGGDRSSPTRSSSALNGPSDIQEYHDKMGRMFEGRKSYVR